MAGTKDSANGFSYAQAAMGRSPSTSQDHSSKVTSGEVTPSTGPSSEVMASSSWAEEMEVAAPVKTPHEQAAPVKESILVETKDEAAGNTETAENVQTRSSSVSSPVVVESKDGEFPSAPNGAPSGITQEETKAQDPMEGSWLQARADRQNAASAQKADEPTKPEKKQRQKKEKEPEPEPAPKPFVMLQDAPPPTVNPWAKRMEVPTPKPKPAPVEQPKKAATSTTAPATTPKPSVPKENQRPKTEPRKKANSISAGSSSKETTAISPPVPTEEPTQEKDKEAPAKPEETPVRRISSDRPATNPWKQGPKSASESTASTSAKGTSKAALPSVKDSKSWPTPDKQPEEKQRPAAEKAISEPKNEDDASSSKPRAKQQWKQLPVVPNILWETPGVSERGARRSGPASERGGRGGGSVRGRGGMRGGANGTNGGRSDGTTADEDTPTAPSRGRPNSGRENATPKPSRAASAGTTKERANESRQERSGRNQSAQESRKAAAATSVTAPSSTPLTGAADSFNGSRRNKSPKQIDASTVTDEVKIPEPIPRKTSVGTQTEANGSVDETPTRDGPQHAKGNGENRNRFDAGRDAKEAGRDFNYTGQPTRGAGKRGGRGRGGSREFLNGHSQPFTNGQAADFAPGAHFSTPYMPAARGQHQNGYTQQARGGWRGNSSRSQSIPMDSHYPGRFYQQGLPMHPQMQGYSGYPPNYDYAMNGMPPYENYVDIHQLSETVRSQIEYYFSLENMLKDQFLRKQMDSQGFIHLDVVASFNRIRNMTHDTQLIRAVCLQSREVEIRVGDDGKERLRKREGWEQWILPMDQRVASAQTEGPQQLHVPQQPQLQFYGQPPVPVNGPHAAFPHDSRRSYDSNFGMMNGGPPSFYPGQHDGGFGGLTNGDGHRMIKSPPTFEPRGLANGNMPNGPPTGGDMREPDAFPNEQVERLTVLIKSGGPEETKKAQLPFNFAASRTFSDGSIDKNVLGDMNQSVDAKKEDAPTTNGDASVNGENTHSEDQSPGSLSPDASRSPERTDKDTPFTIFWVKDSKSPVNSAPPGLEHQLYRQLRFKALSQRETAALGSCPYDLLVLFEFWSHFLIRNFNDRMYNEFKYYAGNDADQRGTDTGLNNLTKFFAESLRSQHGIRDIVARDFIQFVEAQNRKEDDSPYKALRSAWRDGALNLKNRKKIAEHMSTALKEQLEG